MLFSGCAFGTALRLRLDAKLSGRNRRAFRFHKVVPSRRKVVWKDEKGVLRNLNSQRKLMRAKYNELVLAARRLRSFRSASGRLHAKAAIARRAGLRPFLMRNGRKPWKPKTRIFATGLSLDLVV